MKKLISTSLFVLLVGFCIGQTKVHFTNNRFLADEKVYITTNRFEADNLIYLTSVPFDGWKDAHWIIVYN